MSAHLLPLGTNSLIPAFGRQTLANLFESEGTVVLLDAGTGVGRLLERTAREFLSGRDSLSLVLSKYTLDRAVGLSCLAEIWQKELIIYAPGPPLIDADPHLVLDQLLRAGSQSIEKLKIVTVSQQSFSLNNIEVRLLPQTSPGGPVGIRLNNDLAYVSEADTTPQVASFVEGCEFLLTQIPLRSVDYSTSVEEMAGDPVIRGAIDLAVGARVKFVVPVSIHPSLTEDNLVRISRTLTSQGVVGIAPSEGSIFRI